MVIVDLTVAQPTLLGKVGEVEDAVKQLEEEKLLVNKDNGVCIALCKSCNGKVEIGIFHF